MENWQEAIPRKYSENNSFKLGDNLANLGKTFADLSTSDIHAVQYSGPISKLLAYLERCIWKTSRDKAITQAIKKGYPSVNKILNQLQSDLNDVIIRFKKPA